MLVNDDKYDDEHRKGLSDIDNEKERDEVMEK